MRILLYNPDNGVTRTFMPHLWMFLLQERERAFCRAPPDRVSLIENITLKMVISLRGWFRGETDAIVDCSSHREGSPQSRCGLRCAASSLSLCWASSREWVYKR